QQARQLGVWERVRIAALRVQLDAASIGRVDGLLDDPALVTATPLKLGPSAIELFEHRGTLFIESAFVQRRVERRDDRVRSVAFAQRREWRQQRRDWPGMERLAAQRDRACKKLDLVPPQHGSDAIGR